MRAGTWDRLPLLRPLVNLDWSPEDPPSDLLRPRYGVVPFVGREHLLNQLMLWRETDDQLGVVVLAGAGGFGKTRTAVEVCGQAERAGWSAGLLGGVGLTDHPGDALEELASWPTRLLIAVDYAETRPDLVAGLLLRLHRRPNRPPARVVLVVRQALTKRQLEDLFVTGDAREELASVLRRAELVRLDSDEHELDRIELLQRAIVAFAGRVGTTPPTASAPGLRAAHFGRPLLVVAAALLAAWEPGIDVAALTDDELAAEVLNRHEAQYWQYWNRQLKVGLNQDDQRRLVAIAALLGAGTEDEASTLVRLVPGFTESDVERSRSIARWLSRLYGSGRLNMPPAIAPLEPDFLAEVLVARELTALPELIGRSLDAASDHQLARALLVLSRASEGRDQLARATRTALDERLPALVRNLTEQQGRDDELLAAIRLALQSIRPMKGAIAAMSGLPKGSVTLAPLAADITAMTVHAIRALAEANPDRYLPDLATSLNSLSIRLSDLGRPMEALPVIEEAVAHYRTLAEANPDRYLPYLATSLNSLSNHLYGLGRPSEALTASEEAVAHYRALAKANPDRYLPDLASSLNSLSVILGAFRRSKDALTASEEAVTHYRALAKANPGRYLPELAMSLNNLSNHLSGLGRPSEALPVIEEAVQLHRALANANPDRYLHELATSLNNLSLYLASLSRPSEALTASEEAVTHYRALANANPSRYLPDLADSLSNLRDWLSDLGRPPEAARRFAEILGDYANDAWATGILLLRRARWNGKHNHLGPAITDAWGAVQRLDERNDTISRGEARSELRSLRANDLALFDRSWAEAVGIEQPLWLRLHKEDKRLIDHLIEWIDTTNWDDSQSFLVAHSAELLTDQAEAALEHLVDANPGHSKVLGHLEILQAARSHGIEATYGDLRESLVWEALTERLISWLQTSSWAESRDFLEKHGAQLLTDQAEEIIETLIDRNPESLELVAHLGLLVLGQTDGVEEAYALIEDREQLWRSIEALAAPDDPPRSLALARLRVGLENVGDAHLAHAVAALAAGSPEEAERAIVRCADTLAWWQRKTYARRLDGLIGTRTDLAEGLTPLQTLLIRPTAPPA